MIKIEKRLIEINSKEFLEELKKLVKIYENNGFIGFDLKTINSEFKCKLSQGDYFKLCEELNIKLFRKLILFKHLQ